MIYSSFFIFFFTESSLIRIMGMRSTVRGKKMYASLESYHDDSEKMEEISQFHSRHFHCLRSQNTDPLKGAHGIHTREDRNHTQLYNEIIHNVP